MRTPRVSIAGLMGAVLVAALGLAALRNANFIWAGVMLLLTFGVLSLAVVGIVGRGRAERAWWLGFALFGWGYVRIAFWPSPSGAPFGLPTVNWLRTALTRLGVRPAIESGPFGGIGKFDDSFAQVGHCLWALLAAVVGGVLGYLFFGGSMADGNPRPRPEQADARGWWRGPAAFGLIAFVLDASVTLGWPGLSLGRRAGLALLITWATLALAAVGALFGWGRRRFAWFGAVLFGAGYLLIVLGQKPDGMIFPSVATEPILEACRPWFPGPTRVPPTSSAAVADANERILKALEQPIPMRFPNETPLEAVLNHVRSATKGPDGVGIPIYVDPVGLNEVEKTITSPVSINLEGVPLRTTLRLALKQIGMALIIRDGVLVITSYEYEDDWLPAYEDPARVVGHCLLALIAAGLGGGLAPIVVGARPDPDQ